MKFKTLNKVWGRILNILFWSIISAAFIGPGTVTTATKAGSDFQFQLLWALSFSTVACLVLQEASARSTIYSGMNLGQAIKYHYMGKRAQVPVLVLIVGAIILGCAAYETGNILGSVEGISLVFPKLDKRIIVGIIALIAGLALSLKSLRSIANFMGSFVFIMGFTFITTAVVSHPPMDEILHGLVMPSLPDTPGAGLLVLGLVGTTVVPYDLFLGSNVVQKDTTVTDMRIGISVAVILGGIISMAILCVGTEMTRGFTPEAAKNLEFSYKLLSNTLVLNIGQWAVYVFGFGMFAAGFTSAITSPLASALTARSIFEKKDENGNSKNGHIFKWVSYVVLLIGITLGFLQIKPVPAIVAAQAFNGLILPFVAVFLFMVVNNPEIMGVKHVNGVFSNICMVVVTWVTLVLGIVNVTKSVVSMMDDVQISPDVLFGSASALALVITVIITIHILAKRKREIKQMLQSQKI
ncbi:MAG: divalent metal cation transporter [Bacteroidales bacterium]|nr:divalent metal cation transporter [Bacteroidales bacterium]MBO7565748.1 divalent metal cation transporter [Bacteroidales bacterium]MBP5681833.1 divalent metal cation transporter [Bacteroidales bacterium]